LYDELNVEMEVLKQKCMSTGNFAMGNMEVVGAKTLIWIM
tara:strand:- start:1350 stop:1469 length:120 start_codon:yes stop_codon:yes gene_type:complete